MNFQDAYTKVQYSMDTSLLKNRREFAKRMYLEGMNLALTIAKEVAPPDSMGQAVQFSILDQIEQAIAEESNGST